MARITIYDKSGSYKFNSASLADKLGAESGAAYIVTEDGFYIGSEGGQRIYGKFKYVGQTMNVSYLEFTIASPFPIDWNIGDYVDYGAGILSDGNTRFVLFSIPQPKKDAEKGLYGGAFVYSGVQFFDFGKILTLAPFTDMQVKNDNLIHFSTRSGLSTFENVAGVAARLQSCMDAYRLSLADDDFMKGVKFYFRLCTENSASYDRTIAPDNTLGGENIAAYEELISEARAVTIDGAVFDGLNNIQNVWPAIGWNAEFVRCSWSYDYDELNRIVKATEQATGIYYDYDYRDGNSTKPNSIKDEYGQECRSLPVRIVFVNIGSINFVSNAGATVQFARHEGLVNLRRYITNQDSFITRLVAYGSERNLPGRYYNGKDILNADSVDIPNLMLPIDSWGKTYGRVHGSVFNVEYETTLNSDGSIALAVATYNNIIHEYFYSYDHTNYTYTVKDKTGEIVAEGHYASGEYPGTEVLPQTYQESLRLLPDARKAYIEDADIVARYGVISDTVRFDNDENGDIYPSISGMTLQDIIDSIGLSKQKPMVENPTENLIVRRVGDDWISDIVGIDPYILDEIKHDSAYRVMLLRYGYARRGLWFPTKGDESPLRRQNPRPDGRSTHTTRRFPTTRLVPPKEKRESEPDSYQMVRRGYANSLPACRYRVIAWDVLTHGAMPVASQLTRSTRAGKIYEGATLASRLGASLKMPGIRRKDIYTQEDTGITYYRDSKKNGITDLYIGLYHYEKGRGWEIVSNVVKVRGRLPILGTQSLFDCTKVWFGNVENVIYGE